MNAKPNLTYAAAGVDVDAGEDFARSIGETVRSTYPAQKGHVLDALQDFAGLFRLGEGYRDPVLVSGTDGVGTKLQVAQALGRHATIGIDLVAMCVNDLLTTGAVPLFFLDYLAAGKLEKETLTAVVGGIAAGCRESGCALLGGETAEMPGFYPTGVYDLAGFAVGAVEREGLIDGSLVRDGDLLLGLPSSGLHSNGYSLVRRVLEDQDEWAREKIHPALGRPLGEALLEPTRIYASALGALRGLPGIHGIAHVTGGGLPGNLRRILPQGLQASLLIGGWPLPPIFDLLAERGPIERSEMYAIFNMGLGIVVALDPAEADGAGDALSSVGEKYYQAGKVRVRPAGKAAVEISEVEGI